MITFVAQVSLYLKILKTYEHLQYIFLSMAVLVSWCNVCIGGGHKGEHHRAAHPQVDTGLQGIP